MPCFYALLSLEHSTHDLVVRIQAEKKSMGQVPVNQATNPKKKTVD